MLSQCSLPEIHSLTVGCVARNEHSTVVPMPEDILQKGIARCYQAPRSLRHRAPSPSLIWLIKALPGFAPCCKRIIAITIGYTKRRNGESERDWVMSEVGFAISETFIDFFCITKIYLILSVLFRLQVKASTYDHREWRTGLPVRSAVLKPLAGWLVVGWVTTSESQLLYVLFFSSLPEE